MSLLGPPTAEDLISMSCQDSSLAGLFSAARMRDSFVEAISQKMTPSKMNENPKILKLLTELINYDPRKRLTSPESVKFIQDLNR